MASGFLLVFCLCITMTNALFFPILWHIKHHKPVVHVRGPQCPHGWTKHGSRCFIIQNSHATMAEAECACIGLGGNLASIHQHSELSFIRKLIFKSCHVYQSVWIGIFDAIQGGKWLWTDGSKVDYTCWSHGGPHIVGGEHCTVINSNGFSWNHLSCHNRKPFVCARKL
ncbi:galactose-specific lectin nattectin-like [Thunnus maccoyii]|uniref:galactose-specific lectin nattectin-like n=1 Tax=Thunnus maccoyii TaxID=8240 RepID=UPI001C4CA508|nr:galactose-specific lectin nattectin-like [Thunnus maccoyii]